MGEQPSVQTKPEPKTQPLSQETPAVNIPPEPEKKSKTWLIVGFTLLFLSVTGTAGYFSYKYNQVKREPGKETKPSPSTEIVQPSSSQDLTVKWELYRNNEYGYTVKYPNNWYLYESDEVTAYSKNTVGFWPEKGESEVQGIWITVRDDRFIYTDLDSWWEQYKERMLTPLDESTVEEKKFLKENFDKLIKIEKLTILGQPSIRLETQSDYPSRQYRSIFILSKDNSIIDIYTNITDPNNPYYIIYDQILSTFKFIDKSDETTDWEIYSDDTYSFKYPSAWAVQPGTPQEESYWSGDFVKIISPVPTVSISISPKILPYGFGGSVEQKEGETLNITVNGTIYQGIENTRVESGKTKAFVDMEIPINNNEFHIVFGTGYPVNQDEYASYSDYLKYRDTIVQLLSTLEIKS